MRTYRILTMNRYSVQSAFASLTDDNNNCTVKFRLNLITLKHILHKLWLIFSPLVLKWLVGWLAHMVWNLRTNVFFVNRLHDGVSVCV